MTERKHTMISQMSLTNNITVKNLTSNCKGNSLDHVTVQLCYNILSGLNKMTDLFQMKTIDGYHTNIGHDVGSIFNNTICVYLDNKFIKSTIMRIININIILGTINNINSGIHFDKLFMVIYLVTEIMIYYDMVIIYSDGVLNINVATTGDFKLLRFSKHCILIFEYVQKRNVFNWKMIPNNTDCESNQHYHTKYMCYTQPNPIHNPNGYGGEISKYPSLYRFILTTILMIPYMFGENIFNISNSNNMNSFQTIKGKLSPVVMSTVSWLEHDKTSGYDNPWIKTIQTAFYKYSYV